MSLEKILFVGPVVVLNGVTFTSFITNQRVVLFDENLVVSERLDAIRYIRFSEANLRSKDAFLVVSGEARELVMEGAREPMNRFYQVLLRASDRGVG